MQIFCANGHLILDTPSCPQCGWARPLAAQAGGPAWPPLQLGAELGGPGLGMLAAPAAAQGSVFYLFHGELLKVDPEKGRVTGRTTLPAEKLARGLVAAQGAIWLSLSDERLLERTQTGELAVLDEPGGKLRTRWRSAAQQISPPAFKDGHVFLRTSRSELICLALPDLQSVVWQRALRGWWPLEPLIVEDRILVADGRAMYGEGLLCCHRLR